MKNLIVIVLMCSVTLVIGQERFSGRVTDGNRLGLKGVSISLLNTNMGAVSTEGGSFKIDAVAPGKYDVQLTYTGYGVVTATVNVPDTVDHVFVMRPTGETLDAVVVTSQKREERLQKVPAALSVLSGNDITAYRLWKMDEMTGLIPNLFSSNSGDDRNVTFIRGIGTTSYDPAVTTYVDGVNQFTLDTYTAQLLDIERVEVLRGPQGTLYGRNAMGGVINIITKKPDNKTHVSGGVSVGNYNQQRYDVGLRAPLVKDKLFAGASVLYNTRDGYYTNTFRNETFEKQHTFSGNYFLTYKPAAAWNISAQFRHQRHNNEGAFPLVNGVEEAFDRPYELAQNAKSTMKDNTVNGSVVLSYTGNRFNFTAQTAYQANYRYYKDPIDGDFSPADIVSVINNYGKQFNNVSTWTQELRFSSPGRDKQWQWTAGAFLFLDDKPNKQATYYGADAGLFGLPDTEFSTILQTRGKGKGAAAFGQVTYEVTEKLSLTAGMRYDYEHKEYNGEASYLKDGLPLIITQPDTSASAGFSAISPKLAVAYSFTDNNLFYLSYARGFRTGGLTPLSQNPSEPPLHSFKPEYSRNFEMGFKNTGWNNRFTANFTFFFTQLTDAQVPTLVLPQAVTIIRNAGELRSIGAEAEFSLRPVKGLNLIWNTGWTSAEHTDYKLSDEGTSIDLKGKKQIYTPAYTSMFAAQYSYPVLPKQNISLVARGEWKAMGKQYFDLQNNIEQKAYDLFNCRMGVATPHWELMFWVRNMSGTKYIAYAYDFGAVHLGAPKTLGLDLRLRI